MLEIILACRDLVCYVAPLFTPTIVVTVTPVALPLILSMLRYSPDFRMNGEVGTDPVDEPDEKVLPKTSLAPDLESIVVFAHTF